MFRAIGLVIGLIAIRLLMPEVFHAFEYAAISFFKLVNQIFAYAPNSIGSQAGSVGHVSSVLDGINYVPSPAKLPAYIMAH
jgi:hypothetical protein